MESVIADLEQFKQLSEQSQPPVDQCKSLLTKLKIGLTKLDIPSPREIQQREGVNKAAFLASMHSPNFTLLTLSGEILEVATLWSLRVGDETSFERFVAQLKPFYFDYRYALFLYCVSLSGRCLCLVFCIFVRGCCT